MLAVWRRPPWQAAVAAAGTAAALAWAVWGMPAQLTLAAFTQGMAFGLWPICWVVFSAVFFYNLSVAGGDFDVIRRSLSHLTTDRRLLALLVAFGFGALVEGIAGFGAPVAITASMLVGLGFEPISAAVLALVANTAPVAFGSIGIPVTTLGGLLAPILCMDVETTTQALSSMVGRQLPFFSIAIPAYLVVLLAGWRKMVEVLPAVAGAGLSFAVVQFATSNFVGPELTDILAALASLGTVALLLRVWKPREVWRGDGRQAAPIEERRDPPARVARAFGIYAILVVVVLGLQLAASAGLKNVKLEFAWPGAYSTVDGRAVPVVHREPPITAASSPYPLAYRFDFLTSAGSLVLAASAVAFLVMMAFGAPPAAFGITFARTLRQL